MSHDAMHTRFIVACLERAIYETERAMHGIDDAVIRNGLMMGIVAHRSAVAIFSQPEAQEVKREPIAELAHDP
jgi:hypothetical protein